MSPSRFRPKLVVKSMADVAGGGLSGRDRVAQSGRQSVRAAPRTLVSPVRRRLRVPALLLEAEGHFAGADYRI